MTNNHTPDDKSCLCVLCLSIRDLEKLEHSTRKNISVRENQIDAKTKKRFVNMIGQKPMLNCYLDSKTFSALWDTGSMVSVVDKKWVSQNFPEKELLSVDKVLGGDENIQIKAANHTDISVEGVLLFEFSLCHDTPGFTVPFLVTDQNIAEPIVGYNVIEHLVVNRSNMDTMFLKSSLIGVSSNVFETVISLIQEKASEPDFLTIVKTNADVIIPAKSSTQIKCKIKLCIDSDKTTIYFLPKIVENLDDDLNFSESIFSIT